MSEESTYDRFDVEVIARLTRIETKLESVPKLWEKVNEHEKSISRAKGALTILGGLWALIVAFVAKMAWSR